MIDFGAFCYLDVQKTGSMFVEAFLRTHSTQSIVLRKKHQVVRRKDKVPGEKLFFITCRDPVAMWRSLYFFGCKGWGPLYRRVEKDGRFAGTYDGTRSGMHAWISAFLDPETGAELNPHPAGYGPEQAALYGLQTHRFLRLSFRGPKRILTSFTSRDSVVGAYRQKKLHKYILRTESLNRDLLELVEGPLAPYIKDPGAARKALASPERINASSPPDGEAIDFSDSIKARIREREWFFPEELGYARQSTLTPDGSRPP